jgi:hypothetical protein
MNNQLDIFSEIGEYFRPPSPGFFNTIKLAGPELKEAKAQTGLQDQRVLQIFREFTKMTPLHCWRVYCGRFPPVPETSIKRSITVLSQLKTPLLEKLGKEEMIKESRGKKNHQWKIK